MEAQELLKKYNDLFNDFLVATNIFAELRIYLKMKKINKEIKKLNLDLVYNPDKLKFELVEG